MAPKTHAKPSVHPGMNVYVTETFIFTVVVVVAALSIPIYMSGWGFKEEAVVVAKAAETMAKTAETLIAKSAPTLITPQAAETIALAVSAATTQPAVQPTLPQATPYIYRLPNIFPYIWPILRPIIISVPRAILVFIFNLLYVPVAYTTRFLGKVFAPIFLLLWITFDLFIATPVKAVIWVLTLLYPVYVFICIAALVGALLGLVGVGIGRTGLYLVNSGRSSENVVDMDARTRVTQERDWEWERERERSLKGKEREREVPATNFATPTPIPGGSEGHATIKIEENVGGNVGGGSSTRRGRRVEFVD
ncbi:hypothetical protein FRB97_000216 [Tulasnella sp. 331]|nr:hypothetical protein FRB97_000216 [Tulasnella sp. 331]